AEHVAAAPCFGASARGVLDAAALIGAQRKLVVVISDFRLPSSLLKEMFDALAAHDVTPIMLADSQEEALPEWGLSEIADLEDGRRRLVVMRPALRRRWREQEAARRAALSRLSRRHGRELFIVTDRIDAPRLTRHLMAA
ncbi:MxaS protein, partial [Methylocystis sp. 9N]